MPAAGVPSPARRWVVRAWHNLTMWRGQTWLASAARGHEFGFRAGRHVPESGEVVRRRAVSCMPGRLCVAAEECMQSGPDGFPVGKLVFGDFCWIEFAVSQNDLLQDLLGIMVVGPVLHGTRHQ